MAAKAEKDAQNGVVTLDEAEVVREEMGKRWKNGRKTIGEMVIS